MAAKTRERDPCSKWSDLHQDLLNLILSKMSFLNIRNIKYVCSSWYSSANSYLLSYNSKNKLPVLMFPSDEKDGSSRLTFYNPDDNLTYQPHNGCQGVGDASLCISSSHGWLVMLNDKLDQPYLFNPFSLITIQLPPITTFSHIDEIEIDGEYIGFNCYDPDYGTGCTATYVFDSKTEFIECNPISKVDFCSCDDTENVFIVAMIIELDRDYGVELAFCRSKDAMWYRLPVNEDCYEDYRDVICNRDKLYILNGYSIEIWDTMEDCNPPIKKRIIQGSCPMTDLNRCPFGNFELERILVELHPGDFLLVEKYCDRYYQESVGWTYKEPTFVVSKMDVTLKKWVEVESIGNNVLFLGAKMSSYCTLTTSDAEYFKHGCIYFTSYGYKYRYSYLGQSDCQVGVYNIEDKCVEPYDICYLLSKTEPFWIVPNP